MRSIRLHNRCNASCALLAASVMTALMLGGTVYLFAQAGRTPVFQVGSTLAQQAARCPSAASTALRHQCLREIAAAAATPHDALVAAR
jgi:hypothetical protein